MRPTHRFWLGVFLSLCSLLPSAAHADPSQRASQPFALGPPQLIAEKDSHDTYTIVVPLQVQKPEQFRKPGLKVAYVVFDQPITEAPKDLKSDDTTIVLNPGKGGQHQLTWTVRSVDGSISGKASFIMRAPPHQTNGDRAIFRHGWVGLPEKDMGLFLFDEGMQPCSNVLVFRKKDFLEGNGDACFTQALSELSSGDHSSESSR